MLSFSKSQIWLRFTSYTHGDTQQERTESCTRRKHTLHGSRQRAAGRLYVFPQLSATYQRIRFRCDVAPKVLCINPYWKHIYKNLYPYIITVHAGTNLLIGTKQSKTQDVTFSFPL
jgi:hypothetical protein